MEVTHLAASFDKPANITRDIFLVVLSACGGAFDAASYVRFHIFTANMTGNTVLFALSLAGHKADNAIPLAVALGAFVAGAFAAGVVGRKASEDDKWPSRLAFSFGIEVAIIVALAAVWSDALKAQSVWVLVGLASAAMGAQSAITSNLHGSASSTYMTGTLSRIGTSLARTLRMGYQGSLALNVAAWSVYVAAAVGTGALAEAREPLEPVFWFIAVVVGLVGVLARSAVQRAQQAERRATA